MNNRKYKDVLYQMRYINDLRDMVCSSAEIYGEEKAFLVKDVPGGEYRPVSYIQLRDDINALGTKFTEMGLRDKRIAVIGENSYRWVITYLATVNGTGVVVPLDKDLTEIEIANLVTRAEVDAVVFSAKSNEKMLSALDDCENEVGIRIIMDDPEMADDDVLSWDDLIDDGRRLIGEGNRDFIDADIDREAMCSLIFTSGTTGMSKGVMLSHKNLSANVYNMSKYVKIRKPGCGLSVLPMHHTYELTCHVFTAIYQGLTVAICEGLRHIQKNLKECGATVMLGVPIVFETMHKKIWKQAKASGMDSKMKAMMKIAKKTRMFNNQKLMRKIFPQIHSSLGNNIAILIAGGAAINPQVIRDYEALGLPMIQGYGMTENAPIIAVNRDYYSKAESVGKPLPGTEVRIINQDREGIGEIICKGPSVMIGYYKDPEATAEALKDGWLYTGDYGRMDEEGFLYICGRKKNVIVTKNGKNIFPEEIEYLLVRQPYIAEAVVYGVVDKRNDDIIVKAEIFPNQETIASELGEPDEDTMSAIIKDAIEAVNDQMPAYKRVKRFKLRDTEFEKTSTRKIRRTGDAIREE